MADHDRIPPQRRERRLDHQRRRAEWKEAQKLLADRVRQRISAYVAEFFSDRWGALDDQTRAMHVDHNSNEARTVSTGFSDKKAVMPWDDQAHAQYVDAQWDWRERLREDRAFTDAGHLEWLQRYIHEPMLTEAQLQNAYNYRRSRQERRINEDVVGVGDGWHVLCDSMGGRGRGVARVMGEAVRIATEETLMLLRQYDAVLSAEEMSAAMRNIPKYAWRVKECLKGNKDVMAILAHDHIVWSDFGTTMDAMYYSPRLNRALVAHVGDSRTYAVVPGHPPKVQQVTVDHRKEGSHPPTMTRCVLLSRQSFGVDVEVMQAPPGTRFLTMSDGCFSAHEEVHPTTPFEKVIAEHAALPQKQMVEQLRLYALRLQRAALYFDDTSAVSTMVP